LQKNNRFSYLAILFLICLFIFLCIVSYTGVFEDAFISFRYANNLAAGHGLVFNIGEHVWGYSNFLWTVILALGVFCGFSIIAFAKYLGVFSATIIIFVLFYWFLKRNHRHPYLALVSSLFLVTSTHFLIASQNGLETVFFTSLMFIGIILFLDAILEEREFPWYSICFLLASMTRPEGPLLIVVASSIEIILWLKCKKRIILQRLGLAWMVFTVGYAAYILMMFAYYDALLPNAFFVKVDLSGDHQIRRGVDYLLSFLGDIRAAFLLWPIFFILTDQKRALQNTVLMLFLIAYLLFVVRVGGDFQVYFYRFIIPVLPLIFFLAGNGLLRMYELLQGSLPSFANIVCIVIICGLIVTNFFFVKSPVISFYSQTAKRVPIVVENLTLLLLRPEALKNKVNRWFSSESLDIHPMDMVGKVLGEKLEPGVSVATGQAGQIPFYLGDRRVVDMIGLMDDEVAHNGGMSLKYFKKSAVDYCIFYYSETENYFIPLTLYPGIIYSDYFYKNYLLEHVFRHRSIFPERDLFSEKFMLLFKKRKKPFLKKAGTYNLRNYINLCFENGQFTDLKCNLNGLKRGQFIFSPAVCLGERNKVKYSEAVEAADGSEALPVQLDGQRSSIIFPVKKPDHKGLSKAWSYVKLATLSDYNKVKMSVVVNNCRGVQKMVGYSQVPATILSGAPLNAWLPIVCKVSCEADCPLGDWQVEVAAEAVSKPILVERPVWLKDPPWSKSQFVGLREYFALSKLASGN